MITALLLASTLSAGGPAIVEDDYPRALATAKAQQKLLLVDAWAPWCHTCVFMREHVLKDAAFQPFEKDLVFAAVDTEKAKSEAFLEKFPVSVWPTLFFIDPATEKLVFKWVGSADAEEMRALLQAAKRSGDPKLAEADAFSAAGSDAEAAERYLKVVKGGEGRATLSMLSALYLARRHQPCAKAAADLGPGLSAPADRLNAAVWGLGCALELDRTQPEDATLVERLVAQNKAALKLPGTLADDVSGVYEGLVTEREAAKDAAGAAALAREWLAFLDGVAAKATTPAARAAFDAHRVSAAIASKQAERLVDPLRRSEKELGDDYNPPARLALVYRELGRLDDALAAADRALSKCKEGPRKLRLYDTKASILEKKGDQAGRKKVLGEALAYAKALPKAQRPEGRIAALEAALEAALK